MRIAVLGARGHTGRMLVPALESRGAQVAAFGREVDVRDITSLREALRGADAVVNLAGPFLKTGLAPIEAAIERGIPYVDTTGEQFFMRLARDKYHEDARKAGVPVVNALAYEYALSDLVTRAHLHEGGSSLHVLYRRGGAQGSFGTKASVLRVLGAPMVGYENGRIVRERPAAHTRRFDGKTAISFAGGEALTVPRHTPFATVRSYVLTKRPRVARAAGLLAPIFLRGPILLAAERSVRARHEPPRNDKARSSIVLVTERPDRAIRLHVGDPYVITAELCAEGVTRLASASRAIGVVSAAEALHANDVLASLETRVGRSWVERLAG